MIVLMGLDKNCDFGMADFQFWMLQASLKQFLDFVFFFPTTARALSNLFPIVTSTTTTIKILSLDKSTKSEENDVLFPELIC